MSAFLAMAAAPFILLALMVCIVRPLAGLFRMLCPECKLKRLLLTDW